LLNSELEKQQQLNNYKKHYHDNLFKHSDFTDSNNVKQKAAFVAHINNVLSIQEQTILNLQNDAENRKNIWLDIRNKFNKLSEYVVDMENEYQHQIEAREQKDLDTLVNDLYTSTKNFDIP
jgi:flagellar export protein FliJ